MARLNRRMRQQPDLHHSLVTGFLRGGAGSEGRSHVMRVKLLESASVEDDDLLEFHLEGVMQCHELSSRAVHQPMAAHVADTPAHVT